MPRALTLVAFSLSLLAGCTTPPPPLQIEQETPPEIIAYAALQQWLNIQQAVASMPTEEVVAELVELGKPVSTEELYYFGLLNQQLQTFASWTQARDSFRTLKDDKALTAEQQQLTVILQQYNQNRINWYQRQSEILKRHRELEQQLKRAQEDKLLLEQKIQALTDLEAVISTRKEQ